MADGQLPLTGYSGAGGGAAGVARGRKCTRRRAEDLLDRLVQRPTGIHCGVDNVHTHSETGRQLFLCRSSPPAQGSAGLARQGAGRRVESNLGLNRYPQINGLLVD